MGKKKREGKNKELIKHKIKGYRTRMFWKD